MVYRAKAPAVKAEETVAKAEQVEEQKAVAKSFEFQG